jgi:hypothetical protein
MRRPGWLGELENGCTVGSPVGWASMRRPGRLGELETARAEGTSAG